MASLAESVREFAQQRDVYEAFTARLRILLEGLLNAESVRFHVIESRTKSVENFREKAERPGKRYSDPLREITDLSACRVITHYVDEVERVGEIIRANLVIVEEELSHRAASLEADRFGYLSAHYVVELNQGRAVLAEWRAYSGMRAEIQVRSVLQHAWSSISHALNYKQELAIPSALQRRLNRLSGLFELADEEFVGIREQRVRLQSEAAKSISAGERDIELSVSAIAEFIKRWPYADEVVAAAREMGYTIVSPGPEEYYSEIFNIAEKAGLDTIEKLSIAMDAPDYSYLEKLINHHTRTGDPDWNVSVDFLFVLLLIRACRDHVELSDLPEKNWSQDIAGRVIEVAKAA